MIGAYVLVTQGRGVVAKAGFQEFVNLARISDTIPLTRVWVSFLDPTLVYVPGSNTLANTGLNLTEEADLGFSAFKVAIAEMQSKGVEVFLSMGGWNLNCWPYAYMQYSVGGYGPNTPNYWKIQKYGNGDKANCNEANQFCWTCEPMTENTTLNDFGVFPEPKNSATWKQAVDYVTEGAKGESYQPNFTYDINPNITWTDPNTSRTVLVPGSNLYETLGRDPYADLVYLAKDLNVTGIDLDYEEFWHADLHKIGDQPGPFTLPQTVYKYSAIAKDIILNIAAIFPSLKLSTAASAVGAWQSSWWGGNLKGVWSETNRLYPDVINFMSKGDNAGGIDVMTYDLSKDTRYHECPADDICDLHDQVAFYMSTYQNASIPAVVGYEIGQPAYPSPEVDLVNQLPLTTSEFADIVGSTQTNFTGGFFWSIFKPTVNPDQVSPSTVAQGICKVVDPTNPRCTGTLPTD